MRAVLLLAFSAVALQGQLVVDGGASWKGLRIQFETRIEPGRLLLPYPGSVIDAGVSGSAAQRYIDDPGRNRTFGYELRLEAAPDGASATLRIEPLHAPQHAVDSGWSRFGFPAGLPKYPVIPNLRVGDTVALDLMVNPATGQKIVDYLTLQRRESVAPPHDFSFDDIRLSLNEAEINVAGKVYPSAGPIRLDGSAVYIYVEGRGRYVLSLFPNAKFGFQKRGTVGGVALSFRDGDTEFRVTSKTPIAPGEGVYNLYVLNQPAWRPRGPAVPSRIGSVGNLETFLEAR